MTRIGGVSRLSWRTKAVTWIVAVIVASLGWTQLSAAAPINDSPTPQPGAHHSHSSRAADPTPLGQVTVVASATVSQSDHCAIDEDSIKGIDHCMWIVGLDGGSEHYDGTYSANITNSTKMTDITGLVDPISGTGPNTESKIHIDVAGDTVNGHNDMDCCYSFHGTEGATGNSRGGNSSIDDLHAVVAADGTITDLDLTTRDLFADAREEITEYRDGQAMGTFNEALASNSVETLPGWSDGTGLRVRNWTMDPDGTWNAADGGRLATKTMTANGPYNDAFSHGTKSISLSLDVYTGCAAGAAHSAASASAGQAGQPGTAAKARAAAEVGCLAITSPQKDKLVSLTDPQYIQPYNSHPLASRDRAPAPSSRKLIVQGTSTCGCPVVVNGVDAKQASGSNKWTVELPNPQPGKLTLKATAGTNSVHQDDTLIELKVTNPTENTVDTIDTTPAMPDIAATASLEGTNAPTNVNVSWTLDAFSRY